MEGQANPPEGQTGLSEGRADPPEGQTGQSQALPHRYATHTLPRYSIKNLDSLGI